MSRRTRADKREILPEPKYSSRLLAKFINVVMRDGKKSIAENIVYDALETLVQKLGQPPEKAPELFEEVLENLKPVVEVRSRRVGGATYQIPVEVRQDRREALAMRWLIEAARSRSEKNMKTLYNLNNLIFKRKIDKNALNDLEEYYDEVVTQREFDIQRQKEIDREKAELDRDSKKELKTLDKKIVLNSMILKWDNIKKEFPTLINF